MKIEVQYGTIKYGGKKHYPGDVFDMPEKIVKAFMRHTRPKVKPVSNSTDYSATEAAKMVREMSAEEGKAFTQGENRKTVLKELKEEISTKEDKESYTTKEE